MYYNKSLVGNDDVYDDFQYAIWIWITHHLHLLVFDICYCIWPCTLACCSVCYIKLPRSEWLFQYVVYFSDESVRSKNNVVFELRLSWSMLPNVVCNSSNICVMQRCTEEHFGGKSSAHMALFLTLFTNCQWHKKNLVRDKKKNTVPKPFPKQINGSALRRKPEIRTDHKLFLIVWISYGSYMFELRR